MMGELEDRAQCRRVAQRIDRICDAFESSWRSGQIARPEDFLEDMTGTDRDALLAELLRTELELRRGAGQVVSIEEYRSRFPSPAHYLLAAEAETIVPHSAARELNETCDHSAPAASPLVLCPIFRAVPQHVVASQFQEQAFAPGELLLRQGDRGTSLVVISEGEVEISSRGTDGSRRRIDRASRGDVLGEMSLLTSEPRTADAVAIGPVRALVLSAERFHALARQYPDLSVVLTELVARRLGKTERDALTDKVLDRYRISGRLGRGGMGVVYRAENLDSGQTVALKMMSHKLVYHQEARKRFDREAEIIQSLRHPGIVGMYGRFAAFHTYFLVLEYCPGRTLDEVLTDQRSLPEPAVRRILGQLASALLCAHQAGIAHRDIKPANVMLTEGGRVKLMDFGLAEPVSVADGTAGGVLGTPRYMAPEQRRGESFGTKADYFAFGCVAYELLSGQPLFGGDTVEELSRDFRSWQPPILPDVGGDLAALLAAALVPDPGKRHLDLRAITAWADC